jgi:hypothetical protein
VTDYDERIYSNVGHYTDDGFVPITWRELAEQKSAAVDALQPLASFVRDLTRCQHGRCAGDVCGSCGGPSKGNPLAGTPIGYDIYARQYRVEPVTDWTRTATNMQGEPVITVDGQPFYPPAKPEGVPS